MTHTAMSWIGWAMALLVLLPHAWSWWRTSVLFGGIDGALIRQTLYLSFFAGKMHILVMSLAMAVVVICWPSFGISLPSGVVAVMVSVGLVPLLRLSLPPSILFLAASGERASQLFLRLSRSVTPLRAVTLLDPWRMGAAGQVLKLDLMRTSDEDTWKSMVHRIIDIAPIFVIDTVHRTGPLRYEAFLMLSPDRAARTVFISDEKGQCPSLLEAGVDPSAHAIPVTRVEKIEEAVLRQLRLLSARRKDEIVRTKSMVPIVHENWESLPSVLMVALDVGLDGEFLLDQARETNKDLIALMTPLSLLSEDAARFSVDLSWDFTRNPRLVGLYMQASGLAMVERKFLLGHPELLDIHILRIAPEEMSFDDLNSPEPVGVAVHQLCIEWKTAAERCGLEFRFALR